MSGEAALLTQTKSKRHLRGQNGRFIHISHSHGFIGVDRPYSNRVGFVDELWFSKLGDVRPKPREATNCRRFWYNRVPAGLD